MELPENPTIEEVLLQAIQSEIDTRERYLYIAKVSPDPAVRKKLRDLADRELVHRARLERRYKELTGKVPPELASRGQPDLPSGVESFDLPHALKYALEHERESESDYRFLAERTAASPLKNLYMELAEQEWKHKREIEHEYQSSLSPDQFFLDV